MRPGERNVSSGVTDQRFAEYVVQSKLVTPAQVEEARRSQNAALSIGVTVSLAEALVRMEALTASQRGVIEKRLGANTRVVRTMPNLPVQVGEGLTGICPGKKAVNGDLISTLRIFGCIGKTVVVDEKQMDAVTAVACELPHLDEAAVLSGGEQALMQLRQNDIILGTELKSLKG